MTKKKTSELPPENIQSTPSKIWNKGSFKYIKYLIQSMSTTSRQRHASWASNNSNTSNTNKNQHIRLITIGASHYCEKVRWGLDLVESDPNSPIYYTEDAHPPLFASIETLKATGGKASMVPMVLYHSKINNTNNHGKKNETKVLYDSTKILQHFCPFLYPTSIQSQIIQMEEYLDLNVGATIRCLLYYHLFPKEYHSVLGKLITSHSSWIETVLWKRLLHAGFITQPMKYVMAINDDTAQQSLATLRQVFDNISQKLVRSDGSVKEYIMDSNDESFGFTAVDLTLSALIGPLLDIPQLASFRPFEDEELPPFLLTLRKEIGDTLAGRHVYNMYSKHRFHFGSIGTVKEGNNNDEQVVEPNVVPRYRIPPTAICVGGAIAYQLSRNKRSKL